MRTRRHTATFTVLVYLGVLVGALAIGGLLLASGAPGALVVGVMLAAVPVGPLIGCYLWLDRYEPEPRALLLMGLAWGAFAATAGALLLQMFDQFTFGGGLTHQGVLVAPLTEEASKGLFVLLLLFFRRNELDGVLDGIVYAGMVGIGFAFTENVLYLSSAYVGSDNAPGGLSSAVGLFIVRCIFSPFAHPFFTAFTGIGIGLAVSRRSTLVRWLAPLVGYVLAVCAHAAWNGSLMLHGGQNAVATYVFVMIPALLGMIAFALYVRGREGRLLTAALTDCARRGFLDPSEIPWLVRLPARRFCRRNAMRVGGQSARRTMAAYQTEAIELGYLHHRYLNGTAPSDFAVLGQEHVSRMATLRNGLVWPQPTGRHAPTLAPVGGVIDTESEDA